MNDKIVYHTQVGIVNITVFAPKYRRKVAYGNLKVEIKKWKGVNIMEAEICPDYTYACRDTTKNECIKFYGLSIR